MLCSKYKMRIKSVCASAGGGEHATVNANHRLGLCNTSVPFVQFGMRQHLLCSLLGVGREKTNFE